jgi:mono/diheme cytochrome c family protein
MSALRRLALAAGGFAAVALIALAVKRAEQPAPALETPLLLRYGCDTCHAPGAPYHARLRAAAGRTVDEVVERILHADRFDARKRMPVYAGTISEEKARELAAEAQAVGRELGGSGD